MFLPYKIKSSEIAMLTRSHLLNNDFLRRYNRLKQIVETNVNNVDIATPLINGTHLQEQWFPVDLIDMKFQVFLSHSHSDVNNYILPLASWLYERLGLKCFVDSLFWSYANDLLRKMDNIYAKQPDGYYNYDIRNYTTSHIHAMLSMALMKMMSKTELVLFVDSDNSLQYRQGQPQTPSPWIYEEINFASNLQIQIPDRYIERLIPVCESGGRLNTRFFSAQEQDLHVNYDVDLSKFYEITSDKLNENYRQGNRDTAALDYFHKKSLNSYKRRLRIYG